MKTFTNPLRSNFTDKVKPSLVSKDILKKLLKKEN